MGGNNPYPDKKREELVEALRNATVGGRKLPDYLATEETVAREVFGSRAEQVADYGVPDMEMRLIRLRRAIEHAVGGERHDKTDMEALGDFPATLAGLQMKHAGMLKDDRD